MEVQVQLLQLPPPYQEQGARVGLEDVARDQQVQHGVAQELQALVAGAARFRPAAVGHRLLHAAAHTRVSNKHLQQ